MSEEIENPKYHIGDVVLLKVKINGFSYREDKIESVCYETNTGKWIYIVKNDSGYEDSNFYEELILRKVN